MPRPRCPRNQLTHVVAELSEFAAWGNDEDRDDWGMRDADRSGVHDRGRERANRATVLSNKRKT